MPVLALENIGILDSGIVALLGYAVVFFGLILLMLVVIGMGKAFTAKKVKKAEPTPEAAEPVPVVQPVAPGTAGELKLHNVAPKTAAMVMAIVADKLGKPLNELRFLSIKEVDEA